ncbi:MAG: NADPH:quinone oxidoreductase family protein [Comamonas sp.]
MDEPVALPGTALRAAPGDARAYDGLVCEQWCDWRELGVQRLARRPLAPGQVRLAVHHAGVGFALKLFVAGQYQRKPPLPFVPGTEAAGVVIEVGEGVAHLAPGQRVAAALDWGAFAQEAVVSADTVYPVPEALPLRVAAALPITYGTAWAALEWRGQLQPGEVLLVHGASGALGMAAVQIGRAMGAVVIATASTEAKRAAALANGAHHALPADAQALPAAVKALTGGRGVDVVFDPVSGDLFDASLRCTAPGGRMLCIGFASGRIAQVPANLLLVKNVAVIGFNYGLYIGWGLTDERRHHAARVQALVARLFEVVASGRMPAPLTEHFPFADWRMALATTMERRSIGKVILDMQP